jgi:Cu-processing system permease protein
MTAQRPGSFQALTVFQARVILRGRGALVGMIGFALAATLVTVLGLTSFRQLGFGSVGPAAVALLNLALLLPTAQGMVVGAMTLAGERERSFLTMVRAQGVGPLQLAAGAWLSVTLSAALALLLGFGLSAVILATAVPFSDLVGFVGLVMVSLAVAAAAAAIGILIGALAEARLQAGLAGVAVWFVLAIGLDLVLLGVGAFARVGEVALFAAVLANPLETGRVLALLLIDGTGAALGPAGDFITTRLGVVPAMALLAAILAAWIVVPLLLAGRVLAGKDS